MLELNVNLEDLRAELMNVVRLFIIEPSKSDMVIEHMVSWDFELKILVQINGTKYSYNAPIEHGDRLHVRRVFLRHNKLALYDALSAYLGRELPWGGLTGIRPTKPAYDMLREGILLDNIDTMMSKTYRVSSIKSKLIKDIIINQSNYFCDDDNCVNLYAHIPFCTSKCSYCSFMTNVVNNKSPLDKYADYLSRDISHAMNLIAKSGKKLFSVYVGGGTPTALTDVQLDKILSAFGNVNVEFTVEAGRPDTITKEKLEVLKAHNVTRVSVNPQTFNDQTLVKIGRRHTTEDFYRAYESVKKYGFDINLDLIAGLTGENYDDFCHSVKCAVSLKPDNITVHTLSRKNGSIIKMEEYVPVADIERMVDFSEEYLMTNQYLPYYLYRQKNMLGNLENVGYSLNNKQCVNNISVMEESLSVIACGAGAISKRVFGEQSRIERQANLRDTALYFEQFDERLTRKEKFFSNW